VDRQIFLRSHDIEQSDLVDHPSDGGIVVYSYPLNRAGSRAAWHDRKNA
jgi:hypothetical protein